MRQRLSKVQRSGLTLKDEIEIDLKYFVGPLVSTLLFIGICG